MSLRPRKEKEGLLLSFDVGLFFLFALEQVLFEGEEDKEDEEEDEDDVLDVAMDSK
jgi:hypothetical protein